MMALTFFNRRTNVFLGLFALSLFPVLSSPSFPPNPAPFVPRVYQGQDEIQALAQAYPSRITATRVIDDQWALEMDGRWYFWAEGRLLPDEERAQWEEFVSIRFYNYDLGPFEVTQLSPATIARLEAQNPAETFDRRIRFNGFLDSLYQVNSRVSADRVMVRTRILGLSVRVHPLLVDPIRRVNRRVGELAKADPAIQTFVQSLHQAHGYNWRNIANTLRRSFHSYGTAVDLVPYTYQRKQVYWLWAAQSGIERWWELPETERWLVPDKIIEAFEAEGFIWGGKWLSFDNIHFEYRPEVILLSKKKN